MKRRMHLYFLISCFMILFFKTVQAEVHNIWQIGNINDFSNEFVIPDSNMVEEYTAPQDWKSLLDPSDPNCLNWGKFPRFLYSSGEHENVPQEIRINFNYPYDYSNPGLKIRAATKVIDPNTQMDPDMHFIDVLKGDVKIHIDSIPIINLQSKGYEYHVYDYHLEYIKNGLHGENRIILKVRSPNIIRIIFDALCFYIDDTDSDGDGVSDEDEGEFYKDHNNWVLIPTKVYDPSDKKSISLHIEMLKEATPRFSEVGFLDTNTLNLPEWLITGRYLPYGCLGFKAENIGAEDRIILQISFIDQRSQSIYPSVGFHAYRDPNNWEEMDLEPFDGDSARIPLIDGGEGDSKREEDGIIDTKLLISYPRSIDAHVEKRGCFINTVIQGKGYGKDL